MKKLMVGVFAAVAAAACGAASVYVDATRGDDETADGSWEKPAKSIRKGFKLAGQVDKAQKTVVISVQPGTYDGPVIFSGTGASFYDYEDGKGYADRSGGHIISIRGQTGDVDNADPTLVIIDGHHKTNCVGMCGVNASLCNVTCQNGVWGHHQDGSPQWAHTAGGIAIYGGAMASNCIVRWCETRDTSGTQKFGGGVMMRGASRLIDSQVLSCTNVSAATGYKTANGGGICVMDGAAFCSGVLVSNCCCVSERSDNDMQGGGVWLGSAAGTIVNSHIVDCYITNLTSAALVGNGGGVGANHWPSCVTNCLIERCRSKNGGGISCNYGVRVYHSTVTNCWGDSAVCSLGADNPSDDQMSQLIGVRVVGCKNVKCPVQFLYSHIYDCLFEGNESTSHSVDIGATIDKMYTNTMQRTVIRNNVSTGGSTLCLDGGYIQKVQGCWIVGNTAGPSAYAINDAFNGWHGKSFLQECIIASNSAYSALYTGSRGPNAFPDKYSGTLVNEAGFTGLTIAGNTCSSGFAVNVNDNEFVSYVTFTNCFVGANGTAMPFSASCKKGTVGTISHCYVRNDANLSADPDGLAGNVVAAPENEFRDGTFEPRVATHARNAAVPLAYMSDAAYRSMGNGMFTVEKVGTWGVHIVPNDAVKRPRVLGTAPDIGACECLTPGLLLMVW